MDEESFRLVPVLPAHHTMSNAPEPLSRETKRIRLAEAAGWKWVAGDYCGRSHCPEHARYRVFFTDDPNSVVLANKRIIERPSDWIDHLPGVPDFFEDLNATHELEKRFGDSSHDAHRYLDTLMAEVSREEPDPASNVAAVFFIVNATAAQRSNAIGFALGLWQPGQ